MTPVCAWKAGAHWPSERAAGAAFVSEMPGDAEAIRSVAPAGIWGTGSPARGAKFFGVVAKGSAANDASVAKPAGQPAGPCASVDRRADIVVVFAILGPLSEIAMHVVETEGIGGKAADRPRVLVVPGPPAAVA